MIKLEETEVDVGRAVIAGWRRMTADSADRRLHGALTGHFD